MRIPPWRLPNCLDLIIIFHSECVNGDFESCNDEASSFIVGLLFYPGRTHQLHSNTHINT